MKDGLRADASDNALSATEITSQGNPGMPRTPLIGREHEIRVIHETLLREDVPLLSLTGPGGVGKTRLALQVMSRIASDFPGGVFFVELASVRDPELVLPSIARAIGVSNTGSRSVAEQVIQHLLHRRVLLVLDNLEQVVDASPDIANLLSHCPLLTVLVTSRVVLHVSGEHDIPVDPLPPPAAVQLFVTRARAANPSFSLTAGNQAAVTAICARLDGLPLAIELAAARVASLPPVALLARLKDALSLLTVGSRDQPDRLRTMRNAIAWSHDLLSPEEQVLFRRLAVFVDGFSLEAAEELSRIDNQCPDAFNGLASLVDKSIVKEIGGPEADQPRYRMLEIVREYGLERLEESGERDVVFRTHARMYLELAHRAESELTGRDQIAWFDLLDMEHANIRAALGWQIEHNPEMGLGMAGALIRFWDHRSHGREGRQWLEMALSRSEGTPPALRAKALWGVGSLTDSAGNYAQAEDWLIQSFQLAREAGDRYLMGFALGARGTVTLHHGDLDQAAAWYEAGLEHVRAVADTDAIAALLGGLGCIEFYRSNYVRAEACFVESLAIYRSIGSVHGAAIESGHLGRTLLELGQHEQAETLLTEALALSQRVGNKWYAVTALQGLAGLAAVRRDWERSATLFGAVKVLAEASGVTVHPSDRVVNERYLAIARAHLHESTVSKAIEAGKGLTVEQAIAAAIGADDPAGATVLAHDSASANGLTGREIEVLRLLVEGLTDREIAEKLSLSPRTVGGHVTRLLTKLDLDSRTAAAVYAVRHKLL